MNIDNIAAILYNFFAKINARGLHHLYKYQMLELVAARHLVNFSCFSGKKKGANCQMYK